MERRLNKRAEVYVTTFKDNIKATIDNLDLNQSANVDSLIQYIYDYDRLIFTVEDFQKRKRIKNFVPIFDRCGAHRANNEQCTRKKKVGCEFCGTHIKGTPHGIINQLPHTEATLKKVEVWAQDIKGIIYYIDKSNNVYKAEDIMSNKKNPSVIAKYEKNGDDYTIPGLFD